MSEEGEEGETPAAGARTPDGPWVHRLCGGRGPPGGGARLGGTRPNGS